MNFLELPKEMAYLDPGSGSLILQMAIAAILGLGVLLRAQWKKIKSLFGGKETPKEDEDKDEGDDEHK
jgi:hypothetical protein